MPLDFASVTAKLTRAHQHADSLEEQFATWFARHPYSFTSKPNHDFTEFRLSLRIEPFDYTPIGLTFGDCIHNLRSALDHVVYAVAATKYSESELTELASGGDFFNFPIVDTPKSFDKARTKFARLGTKVIEAIGAAQEYAGPDPSVHSLMRTLRNLDNQDKHRTLHIGFGDIGPKPRISYAGIPAHIKPSPGVLDTRNRRDGAEVLTVTTPESCPRIEFKIDLPVAISVDYTVGGHKFRSNVVKLARALGEHVGRVALAVAEAAK